MSDDALAELRNLLENLVRDWSDQCCDHPRDCACSMAQAWRLINERRPDAP